MRVTITNNSKAPQGVYADDGLRFIEPGAQRTITVAEDYVDRVKSLPFFAVEMHQTIKAGIVSPEESSASVTGKVAETFDAELLEAATDAELAEMHKDKFGKAPHHAAKRETIIAKLAGTGEA
ncbi:MAG: hypothetical protein J7521_20390 [Caulobacter sp.]|nr:hypothetical protein [Caulobacter sp.]